MNPDVISPVYQTFGSVCFDIHTFMPRGAEIKYYDKFNNVKFTTLCDDSGIVMASGMRVIIPTGLKFDIPHGYHLKLYLRSSAGMSKGLVIPNGLGIIDTDYVGQVYIGVYNPTDDIVMVSHKERIAQIEVCKSHSWDVLIEQTDVEPELRGNRIGGIGSTGK